MDIKKCKNEPEKKSENFVTNSETKFVILLKEIPKQVENIIYLEALVDSDGTSKVLRTKTYS